MSIKNIFKPSYWKTIAAASILSSGLSAPGLSYASDNPCDQTQKKHRDYIYSNDSQYTTAGDGRILKRIDLPLTLTPNEKIDLDTLFYTKSGKQIKFQVLDPKIGLENVISELQKDPYYGQTPEGVAFRKYLDYKLSELPPNDHVSLFRLNRAVADNCIDPIQDSLYVNGSWTIQQGKYLFKAYTEGDKAESVPVIYDITLSKKDFLTSIHQRNLMLQKLKFAEKEPSEIAEPLSEFQRAKLIPIKELEKAEEKPTKPKPKIKLPKDLKGYYRFSAGVGAGTNSDFTLNLGGEYYFSDAISAGLYAMVNLSSGEISDRNTLVTEKERELIGPGTYKHRIDEITTTNEKTNAWMSEIGARARHKITNYLNAFANLGIVFKKNKEKISGKSIVWLERNQEPLGDVKTISNQIPETSETESGIALGAGLEARINGNFSIDVSANYREDDSNFRASLNYIFWH